MINYNRTEQNKVNNRLCDILQEVKEDKEELQKDVGDLNEDVEDLIEYYETHMCDFGTQVGQIVEDILRILTVFRRHGIHIEMIKSLMIGLIIKKDSRIFGSLRQLPRI